MQILPQDAWFGLTKGRLRVILALVAGLLVVCATAYGAALAILALEARSAAAFLNEVRSIQLGQAEASVIPFINRYEDKTQPGFAGSDTHRLLVDPWHLYRPFPGPTWLDNLVRRSLWESGDFRRRLGLRAWVVQATITFTEGTVHSVGTGVLVEGENEWLLGNWHYSHEIPSYLTDRHKGNGTFRPEMSRYVAHWTHVHAGPETGEGLVNSVTPDATPEESNAARNINLQCLTSFRGCRSLCELMPDAHRFMRKHDYPGLGWNSGSWGPQDRACE